MNGNDCPWPGSDCSCHDRIEIVSPDWHAAKPRHLLAKVEGAGPSPGFSSCWADDAKRAFQAVVDRLECGSRVRAVDVVLWIEECDENK